MTKSANERVEGFCEAASRHYPPVDTFPYHGGRAHLREVITAASELATIGYSRGLITAKDSEAYLFGMAYHDAGYGQDLIQAGFETPEDYAARIALAELPEWFTPDQTDTIRETISATKPGAERGTSHEIFAHIADLAYFGLAYEQFKHRVRAYWQEIGSPRFSAFQDNTLAFGQHAVAEARHGLLMAGLEGFRADMYPHRVEANLTVFAHETEGTWHANHRD